MLKEMAINTMWVFLIVLFASLIVSIIITPILKITKTQQKADNYDELMSDFSNFLDNLPPEAIQVHKIEKKDKND